MAKFRLLLIVTSLGFMLSLISCSGDDGPIVTAPPTNTNTPDDNSGTDDLEEAPAYSLKTFDDMDINSEEFKDKVSVIFFFGYNCPPCKGIAPDIESRLNEEFGSNSNFAIIGIDQWDGSNSGVENFKNSTGVTFPLGVKGSGIARDFGSTYDRLVVVNKESKIAFKGSSVAANDLSEVVDLVKTLLN